MLSPSLITGITYNNKRECIYSIGGRRTVCSPPVNKIKAGVSVLKNGGVNKFAFRSGVVASNNQWFSFILGLHNLWVMRAVVRCVESEAGAWPTVPAATVTMTKDMTWMEISTPAAGKDSSYENASAAFDLHFISSTCFSPTCSLVRF